MAAKDNKNSKKQGSEETIRPESVVKLYKERLVALKRAQEYAAKGDIPKAVDRYKFYLKALATFYDVEEEKLRPSLFDAERDLPELLLISHAYWDLAKAYDRAPSLHKEFLRCLDQFALFTQGFKFQHVNARMLKKFLRKKMAHNPQAFKQTLEKIQVDSKGCFVASYAYGETHDMTESLRDFKTLIAPYKPGRIFIDFYYSTCPFVISFFKKHQNIYQVSFWVFIHPVCLMASKGTKVIRTCLSLKN